MQLQTKSRFQSIRNQLKQNLFENPVIAVEPKIATSARKFSNNSSTSSNTFKFLAKQKINISKLSFSDKYTMEEDSELGQGCHSIVKLATEIKENWLNPQYFAVKIFRSGDPEIVNTIINTFKNQMSLTHPFIIKAKELFIDQNTETDYLVMEYSNLPSLESIILKQGRLDELKVCLILKSCLEAVSHMHSKGIAHRDLKPDNILVEYPFKNKKEIPIKIIDFGVSARFSHLEEKKAYYDIKTKDMWTRTGNHFYCAPEIFQGGGYNQKVDDYSLGIIAYQLLSGKLPFQQDTIADTMEQIINEQAKFDDEVWSSISVLGKDLIQRLLEKNPKKRISSHDSLFHPWFLQIPQIHKHQIMSTQKMEPSIEDFFKQNQNYRSPTFKNLNNGQSSANTFEYQDKLEQTGDQFSKIPNESEGQDRKVVWEHIEIGIPLKDENDDTESPLIKLKKIQKYIEKNVFLKKRTIKNKHRRFTMKQLWMDSNLECMQKNRSNSVIFKIEDHQQFQFVQDSEI